MKILKSTKLKGSNKQDPVKGVNLINRIPFYAPLSDFYFEYWEIPLSQISRETKKDSGKRNKQKQNSKN